MSKIKFATVWLDGCSGCHMSFLDMDQRLLELADKVDVVYSPLVDFKTYPDGVDICLVEGAVSSGEDLEKIRHIRSKTKTLISLGDCAITANVPSMRNRFPVESVYQHAYHDTADLQAQTPNQVIPPLLPESRPVHEYVRVDFFICGCPPSADVIHFAISELLEGRVPDLTEKTRFGS